MSEVRRHYYVSEDAGIRFSKGNDNRGKSRMDAMSVGEDGELAFEGE